MPYKFTGDVTYGRPVVSIFIDGKDVNLEMARTGWAVVYERYIPQSAKPRYLAVQRDAKSYQAHAELGSVLARQGKTEEAIERFTQSTEISHYAPAHFALGELYRSAGRMEEAEQHYELWKKSPEVFLQDPLITTVEGFNYSSKVRLRLARQLFQLGRREHALKVLRDLIRLYPDNASVHIRRAQNLFQMARQDEAIEVLREFIRAHPDNADAHAALAQAYSSMGQTETAAFHWRERNRILTADGTAHTSETDQ